jgi:glycine/D-amino acid oxidase-like deaminating enzyme
MQESIWRKNIELPRFPPLSGAAKTDVLIIGGGMAGLLCAYGLKQAGVDCLVIEADRIGSGVTAGTTAKITSQHGLCYTKLVNTFGPDIALGYWHANQAALERFRELATGIPCDLEVKDSYIYTLDDTLALDTELEALHTAGIPAELVHRLKLPIPTAGAVCFRNQAQFHPLKFLAGLVTGLNIREHTRAYEIEKGRVWTNQGCIRAKKIIVATHFPIWNRRGLYFMKQYQSRSHMLALEGAANVEGMYLDGSGQGFSFRSYGNILLLGEGGCRTGKEHPGWEPLEDFARIHYPKAGIAERWAAQDCMTLDGIPYIGQYSPRTPWLYVATGFHKWGMTGSMVAAQLLRDRILGRDNPYAHIFDPARSMLHPQLAVNVWESALHLLKPTAPRCPHLGCALEWNPQEHSWDCPCHGSRFSESGKLLDNPAKRNLKGR